MTVTLNANAGTFVAVLDLGGPVLRGPDPEPQTFNATFTEAGGVIRGLQVVPRFGVPNITISPTGTVTGGIAPLPGAGSILINGTVNATTLIINYTASVSFPAPTTFAGALTLTK